MSAGRPSREVAHRLFAVEFEDATVSLTESDDDMAPTYVVTPTGALVNRAFVVGTLTSVDQVGDDIYRGRVADPTETFVTYAGQYQPEAANFLAEASPPAIVALTGKARTFQPDGSNDILSSLRPERLIETTVATRDHWVVEAATHTLGRIELLAAVRAAGVGPGDVEAAIPDAPAHVATGITRAIEHYDPSATYLAAVHERAVEALEVVAGEREAVDPLMLETDATGGETTYEDLAAGGFVADWLGTDIEVDAAAVPAGGPSERSSPATATEPESPTETADEATDSADPTAPDEPTEEASDPSPATAEEVADLADAAVDDDTTGEDELYELSDAEREAVEAEYDVGFESGSDVEGAGESADADTDVDPSTDPPADESSESDGDDADDDEDDLEAAVLEQMRALDEGDGAPRSAVVDAVVDETAADADAVDDAVQDALMSGSCYEPTEGRLKPI